MKKIRLITILFLATSFRLAFSQITFNYTGGVQNYVVPAGVTVICFTVDGAQGNGNASNLMLGGLGGRVTGQMLVTAGQVLQINVGGGGLINSLAGGFNGGGNGAITPGNCCLLSAGGGGGGASDIRINPYTLNDRVVVGGGGGGTGGNRSVGCSPGCGGGGGGGYYGGGGGGAYGGSPGFGGSQVAGGLGGASCCGCPNAPQPGFNGVFGLGGAGGNVGCNGQGGNNPGCAGGIGGTLVGGQGPNCTGGTGCPSTWAGASGGGGSNFAAGTIIGPAQFGGIVAGNGVVTIIPNCCTQPTIVPVANPNPICAGQTTTLTATGAGTGGTYTWTPGPITGSMVTVTPTASTVYTVTGTNTLNCVGTATVLLTVNPSPTPTPNSNSPICTGGTINLTVNAMASYTWAGPNAFASNLQNPSVNNATAINAGNYTVTVTSALGCTASAVTNVIVNPVPIITPTNTGPYCAGTTILLSVGAAATYTWTGPNAFASNLQNPTIVNAQAINAGVYTVTVTAVGGCKSTGTTTVVINPSPTPTATSNSPVCVGNSINFTGLGGTTYTWTGPGGYTSNAQNPSIITSSVANSGNYTLTVTNPGGCTNSIVIAVVVNPLPVIAVNNPTVCLNTTFTLTATGGTAYAWTGPNAFNSVLQNPPFASASPSLNGNYTVMVTSASGCNNTAVSNVLVVPLPTVSVVGTNTLCSQNFNGSPNTVLLTASGAATYTWSLPAAYIAAPNLNSYSVTITPSISVVPTVATVTLMGSSGSCTNSTVYTLTVIPNPTITVTSGSMCAGTSVVLTANNATTYTWTPGASLNMTSGPSVIASPSVTTMYSVIGSSVGCNSQTQNGTASVVANPTVSIAPLTPTICFGNSIGLTASGATNYTWSPNTAITATIGANVTVNPTVTTMYTIIGEQATCTNVATSIVTVIALPVININLNTPNICMNNFNGSTNTVNINASGATTYTWTGFTGLNANTTSGAFVVGTAIPNAAIGSGTVVGFVGTCSNVASFSVIAIPNPTISVPSESMCAGTSVVLNASGADTYVWSPSNTLNSSTGSSVIASPNANTVYSIIGSSLNCNSTTETATVTVVANPVVVVSPVTATICAGSQIGLTAFGATDYTWTPGASLNTNTGYFVIASPTITTNYTVIGSQATCTNSTVRQVQVIDLPQLQSICEKTAICEGDKTNINANGAGSYTWIPSSSLSSATSNFVIASPLVSTVYSLIGNNGLCTATLSVPIEVIPKPVLNLSTSNQKICFGQSSTIFASGARAYSWTPTGNANETNTTMATVSPSVSTNYTVTGYNFSGNMACPFTKEILIEIVPQVTAGISGSVAICEGGSTKLNSNGSNTYIWTPPLSGLSNSLVASPYASPKSTTIYTVQVSNDGYCGGTATVLVKVNPQPTVDAGPDATYNSDDPMYLNARGTGTLTWILGDDILCSVCPNTQIMPKKSGVYQIQTVNEFGCKATDEVNIEVTNDYSIFVPNSFTPNYDGLNDVFFVYGVGITKLEMIIYDRWYHKIFTSNDQLKGWDGTYGGVVVKNDSYIWTINYTTYDNKKHTKTGFVNVIREE